jgi:hypothetical protein
MCRQAEDISTTTLCYSCLRLCDCSYRRQFKRLRALLDPPEPTPTALKGQALCYNASTGRLVSYNARQRLLSVLMEDGTIRSEVSRVPSCVLPVCATAAAAAVAAAAAAAARAAAVAAAAAAAARGKGSVEQFVQLSRQQVALWSCCPSYMHLCVAR